MPPASPLPTVDTAGDNTGNSSLGEIGLGLAAQNSRPPHRSGPPQRSAATNRPGNRPDTSKLWCSHCGKQKHTRETCFQRLGYPEWWEERQKAREAMAKLAVADGAGQPQPRQIATGNRGSTSGERNPGGGSVRGAGNLAERTEMVTGGAKTGESSQRGIDGERGIGLGFQPSPNSSFSIESPNLLKSQMIPHVMNIRPPDFHKLESEPQTRKNRKLTPRLSIFE